MASYRSSSILVGLNLNQDIKAYMHEYNHAVMKNHGVSRYERFQREKHLLLPLPRDSFCIPEYRTAKDLIFDKKR
ncbi:MAG: hypothetical protein OXC44_04590 [Proteobacteria bacterium]|nr:hypothetical protein [Pseudomonadota bacterium]